MQNWHDLVIVFSINCCCKIICCLCCYEIKWKEVIILRWWCFFFFICCCCFYLLLLLLLQNPFLLLLGSRNTASPAQTISHNVLMLTTMLMAMVTLLLAHEVTTDGCYDDFDVVRDEVENHSSQWLAVMMTVLTKKTNNIINDGDGKVWVKLKRLKISQDRYFSK